MEPSEYAEGRSERSSILNWDGFGYTVMNKNTHDQSRHAIHMVRKRGIEPIHIWRRDLGASTDCHNCTVLPTVGDAEIGLSLVHTGLK